MSDLNGAVLPVPSTRLEQHYDTVVAMQAQQALTWRRAARRARWRDTVLLGLCLAQSVTIVWLAQRQSVITVWSYLNKNGVHDTATTLSSLPPTQRVAGIESLLWQVLRFSQHYAPSEADNDYAIVSAMTTPTVRDQYQKWANPKLNPQAPAVRLAPNGYIRVYRIDGNFIRHSPDYDEGVYQIRFCRLVVQNDQSAYAQRMSVALTYKLVATIPLWQRVSFNHAGLIITEYPGPETEGAVARVVVPSLGGDDPCNRPRDATAGGG